MTQRKIEDINLSVHKRIGKVGSDPYGCCLLSDGRTAFANFTDKMVKIFDTNGIEESSIDIPGEPFDVIQLNETTIAVSCLCSSSSLYFIDVNKREITKSLLCNKAISGITIRDENHLICCEYGCGIRLVNLDDDSLATIATEEAPGGSYVTSFGENVIQTNWRTRSVICFNMIGEVKWSFKDETILPGPCGVTSDGSGHLYVAGGIADNIVIISPDGKQQTEIKCGLEKIRCLDYDKVNDCLLLVTENGEASIMKLNVC